MTLGEKLLQSRLEAGLSQRQLCGDQITRNMLSRIEHGTARPSMDTLRYLAARLEKPVSYFLEEDTVTSSNFSVMVAARAAFDNGDFDSVMQALADYRDPDEIFYRERLLLETMSLLALAETAISQQKYLYAKELLDRIPTDTGYRLPELERRRLLLLGRMPDADRVAVCQALPSPDEELLLRTEAALAQENSTRALDYLAAAEDQTTARWNLLRGKALFVRKEYAQAAECLKAAEAAYPRECPEMLETCYRELKDFEQAYFYACKQKK